MVSKNRNCTQNSTLSFLSISLRCFTLVLGLHNHKKMTFHKYWYILVYSYSAASAAKSLQSCPILCNPIDGSPPDSPIPGILQARTLEWVAISFSNAWKWKVKVKSLSRVRLLGTPWTAAYQAPPSMGFSRQEYWSGVPLPSPLEQWVDANNWDRIRFGIRVVSLLLGYVGFEVPDNYLGESVSYSVMSDSLLSHGL